MSKSSFFGGLAIFAMFFGSGNLIFPLLIGKDAGSNWIISTLGLGISGILLPMLGLVTMLVIRNNMEVFFHGLFNKTGAYLASIFVLLLCGPFGVAPRCITVAQGAWNSFSPNSNHLVFSAICCLVVWSCIYFKTNLIDLIGKYFTPIKLGGLLTIIFSSIFVAIKTHPVAMAPSHTLASESFANGLIDGYGTMDLFAALFFGPTIVAYFAKPNLSPRQINKECITAIAFGFSIIFFVYSCLIYLGSTYAGEINDLPPTEMLPSIVHIALGKYSSYVISFTLIVATLVTAIALISVTVDYITAKIKYLAHSRIAVLNVSIVITFIFSVLGFTSIMAFLMPLLKTLYPLTILILFIHLGVHFKKLYFCSKSKELPKDLN